MIYPSLVLLLLHSVAGAKLLLESPPDDTPTEDI